MEIQVLLDPEHQGRIEILASNMGIWKRLLLEDVVAMGMGEAEDFHLAAESDDRVRGGEEEVLSWDEAMRELGLDD